MKRKLSKHPWCLYCDAPTDSLLCGPCAEMAERTAAASAEEIRKQLTEPCTGPGCKACEWNHEVWP